MTTQGGLYEKVLASLGEGAELPRPRPPRASAAVVPWRRGADGRLEVYWVERAAALAFMGGWHAFPGGGLSRQDPPLALRGRPLGVDGAPADGGLPESITEGLGDLGPILAPGLAACALRELFEELGLLLATDAAGAPPPAEWAAAARLRLLAGGTDLATLLAERQLVLDPSPLDYAGRWLTPPLAPMRFDTRFFLLEWSAAATPQPSVLPGELAAGEWIEPARGLELWRAGEVITAPPILHILQVLAEEGPDGGRARLWDPRETVLGAFRRIEFRPGVLLFPLATPTLPPAGHTNAYLLGTGDAVLIDPGSPFPGEIERLLAALAAADERLGRRVTAIWLTHHHPDHIGGVEAVRRALGVPLAAHAATARHLAARGIAVDRELSDGERVVLAGDPPFPVRVLHTPGHARGHLCFLDETRGSLIAGDLVAGFGTIVIDPPEGDMDDYLRSLERMRDLAPRALFPSHGPAIRGGRAKLQEYLDHRAERERRILAAWRDGLRQPLEMLERVYDELPAPARPLAERQVIAHLERLERAGRLAG